MSIVGPSGSGKTTLARELAARLDAPFVELDSIVHQAGWQDLDADEFRRRVGTVTERDRWVIDGNYGAVRPLVVARATTLVWLDYDRPLVMARIIRRSVMRTITRRELWNGNREMARQWMRASHPIRESWSHHSTMRVLNNERLASPQYAHLEVVHLRNPTATRRWLADQ